MFLRRQPYQKTPDFQKQLRILNQDRQRFQQKLEKASTDQTNKDHLIEKYRFYIRDLLERPDGRAAKICLALSTIELRLIISKNNAFNKLKRLDRHTEHNCLEPVEKAVSRRQLILISTAFQTIKAVHKCRNTQLVHVVSMIKHKRLQNAFNNILKNTFFDILNRKDEYIGQIQAQLNRLEESQSNGNSQDMSKLHNDLKDKQKQIKRLQKVTKDIENKYEIRIQKLEEEVNKLSSINVRLIEEVEQARERRGDISGIQAVQHQNSMSMELFEQGEVKKEVEEQLSQKYLRQVICLKENIESIKANFIGLLKNGLQMDKAMLTNLLYLMNFNEEERKMIGKSPLVAGLLQ